MIGGIFGLTFILSVLFANQLGFDNNQVWGMKRYIIFFAGSILLALSILYQENNFIGKVIHTTEGRFILFVIGLNVLIFLIYFWFASTGTWQTPYNETYYYNLLATAFRHGQIALEVKPDPALLVFKDESLYEPSKREGIPVL